MDILSIISIGFGIMVVGMTVLALGYGLYNCIFKKKAKDIQEKRLLGSGPQV